MNLLNRAKRLLQGQSPSGAQRTQYFNVLCPDGHRMSGVRNEGYQALRCPSCGEGVFILPRSPLPEVAAPSTRSASRATRSTPVESDVLDEPVALTDPLPPATLPPDADLIEIEWEEEVPKPAPAPPPAAERRTDRDASAASAPPAPKRPASPGPKRSPTPRPAPSQERPTAHVAAPEPVPFDARAWVTRHRNPLIFGGVVLVVLATFAIRQRRSELQDSPRLVEIGRTEGFKALDDGQWDKAHQLLSRANRAVNALGGKVDGAEEVRQAAAEAALYANRLSEPLENLLAQADPSDTSTWPHEFDTLYKGKAVVVQAEVTAVPGVEGASEYDLDYRILPNGEGDLDRRRGIRVGRFDLSRFRLIQDLQPKRGTQLRFAARLQSFTFNAEREEWLVGFEPDSGVILQHEKALKAALLTADAESPPEEGKP